MIEMDRFVTTLKGEETEEIIERQDYDSAATMKHYETNDRQPSTIIQSVCTVVSVDSRFSSTFSALLHIANVITDWQKK